MHFQEAARVLKPSGHFLILNFSYRGDLDADRADISRLAARAGFRSCATAHATSASGMQ